ncbi:hypothetical protein C7212DRAFT_366943 [Tuber magnatum]|uniref:Uncharacterized protein n=1 Tax=Tuber magnatum TaxID=42249 RepID=A0A317SBT6_9PEZI|nr:hypothetical protein C7212DRAFT_366943 [Tuber magnatum]
MTKSGTEVTVHKLSLLPTSQQFPTFSSVYLSNDKTAAVPFGGFTGITRDTDRAYSAGYKSQRQSYGRAGRDRGEGGGGGIAKDCSNGSEEHHTRLNGGNDDRSCGPNQDRGGAESRSPGCGSQECEETRGCPFSTCGGQGSERGRGLSGDGPSRTLGSAVSVGIETFGKACEKSSSLNQEGDGGSNCQSDNNRVENSAFGNRAEKQESEEEKGGEAIGSVLNTGMPSVRSVCRQWHREFYQERVGSH